MRKLTVTLLSLGIAVMFYSCNSKKQQDSETTEETVTSESLQVEQEIMVTPVSNSPTYEDAILAMNNPGEDAQLEAGNISFAFDVTNYELATQTPDATTKMCANSAKGQHIHLILNNEPYSAHYEPAFEKEMEPGHYVALAFLSRSYHESIKQPEAYVLRQFTVGDAQAQPADLTKPHMFYSRPKGTYQGPDTKKILLDFYLVNADLSPDGYKVRATINGKPFMIDKWEPQFVEGLPMGVNTFKLELLDSEGKLVDSPFNPVERTVTLEGEEAM